MWHVQEGVGRKRRTIHPDDFRRELYDICERHHAQGRAWAFALLLYDEDSTAVRAILDHDPYWADLDSLVGTDLSVFSVPVSTHTGRSEPYRNDAHTIGWMYAVESFQETTTVDWPFEGRAPAPPAFVFFQIDGGSIIDTRAVALRKTRLDAAYSELAGVLEAAVDSLRKVTSEADPSRRQIFNLISEALDDHIRLRRLAAVSRPLLAAISVAQLIDWLVGLTT